MKSGAACRTGRSLNCVLMSGLRHGQCLGWMIVPVRPDLWMTEPATQRGAAVSASDPKPDATRHVRTPLWQTAFVFGCSSPMIIRCFEMVWHGGSPSGLSLS